MAVVPEWRSARIRARQCRLEDCIANREHLVNQQDVRIEVRGNRKAQPHAYARGAPLHRHVDERCHAGEGDNLVELGGDFPPAHACLRIAPLRYTFSRPESSG